MVNTLNHSEITKKCAVAFACLLFISIMQATPLFADSVLNFPRLSADPSLLTGIAIVNPTAADAQVALTAYGADGQPLKGEGVTNPISLTVPAGQQLSKLTFEL